MENGKLKMEEEGTSYMRRALSLARRGIGFTSPNPMVGAVLIKNGKIISEGFHQKAGLPHAEIEALRKAGEKAHGATLYVSLEPCAHWGETPPCTSALIRAGVKRVIFAMRDPNPLVNGKGIGQLRRAGVEVVGGLMEKEAKKLNEVFTHVMTTGFPFVTAKIAQSLDGKIATEKGESRWLTGESARRYVHEIRSQSDAILVGIRTVSKDDPALDVRGKKIFHQPKKIVLDPHLRISPDAKLFATGERGSQIIVAASSLATSKKAGWLKKRTGCEIWSCQLRGGRFHLEPLFRQLVKKSIHHVLAEGGGETIASLLQEKLVKRVIWFIAPLVIGGRGAPTSVGGKGIERLADAIRLKSLEVKQFESDLCIEGYLNGVQGVKKGPNHVYWNC